MNRAPALDAAPPGTLPEGTVVYATGDIHGRSDLLARLHGMIRDDASRRPARRRIIVYLGDYISRGPDSRGVVDMIIGHPLPGFERIALRGNHEDLVLRFLGGELGAGGHWLDYGGIQALASYGIDWRGDQTAASSAGCARCSPTPSRPPITTCFARSPCSIARAATCSRMPA